jgi:hypothetical protein
MSYPAAGIIVMIMTREKVTSLHYTCQSMHEKQLDILAFRPPCGFFPCQCHDIFWTRNRTKWNIKICWCNAKETFLNEDSNRTETIPHSFNSCDRRRYWYTSCLFFGLSCQETGTLHFTTWLWPYQGSGSCSPASNRGPSMWLTVRALWVLWWTK